jgi:hypothetical protein
MGQQAETTQDLRDAVAYYFNGVTTADIDRYIDPVAGDDINGTGLIGAPYATPDRAKLDIPRRVEHMVHLHVAAGAYGAMPDWTEFTYGKDGWISVDASAAIADASAVLVVDVAGSASIQEYNVIDIPIVGGGLGVDAYRDKLLLILTGASAGYLVPVIGNTATTLRCGPMAWETLAGGDTVKIVEPAATFTSAGAWNVSGSGLMVPHLYFLGVKIIADTVTLEGVQAEMVGCVLTVITTLAVARGILASSLAIPVAGVDNAVWAATGAWLGGTVINGSARALFEMMTTVYGVLFSEVDLILNGFCYLLSLASRNGGGIGVELWDGCTAEIMSVYAHAKSDSAAFLLDNGSGADCYDIFANAGKYGLQLKAGVSARVNTFGGTAANIVTAGALVGGGSRIASKACTLASTGAVAVAWGSGAAASAWPAANNKVDDAIAALVVGAN